MPSPVTLVVLAAGLGSRYAQAAAALKQVDGVGPNGEPLLEYSVYDALQAGISRVVFVVRRDIEAVFRRVIGDRIAAQVRTDYVHQELDALPHGFGVPAGRVKPWGTGHAVLVCAKAVTEPFTVINADDYYGRDAYAQLYRHLTGADDSYAMVGFRLCDTLSDHGTVSRGICQVDANGYLRQVVEQTKIAPTATGAEALQPDGPPLQLSGQETASMGIWGFTPAIFPQLAAGFQTFLQNLPADGSGEFFLPSCVDTAIKSGASRLRVLTSSERWFGMTHATDRAAVANHLAALTATGFYPGRLWR